MKLTDSLLAQSKPVILGEAAALIALIGFIDAVTTWEVSLFIFYAIPIFLVTWRGTRELGIALAIVCGAVWFLANAGTHPYAGLSGYGWATVNRTVYFIFVAIGATAMRAQREESEAKIAALTRARELEREIVRASESEQMRIGQDLHDGICQNLAAIDCATQCLKADLESEGLPQARAAGLIQKLLKDTVLEARNLARGIFPVHMDVQGLAAALQDLVSTTNQLRQATIEFETYGEIRIEVPETSMHLYRIAQEALSNAMRHANATRVTVSLTRRDDTLLMIVADNGRGLPATRTSPRRHGAADPALSSPTNRSHYFHHQPHLGRH